MDNLEKFIRENKQEFDLYKPPRRVWTQVKKQLPAKKSKTLFFYTNTFITRAAIIVLFVTAGAVLYNQKVKNTNNYGVNNPDSTEIVIPQIAEVEQYYNSEVDRKYNLVVSYSADFPGLQQDINTDFTELDSVYVQLKRDLKDGADNEEVINAMIENYRLKLQILEDVLAKIQKMKNPEGKKEISL